MAHGFHKMDNRATIAVTNLDNSLDLLGDVEVELEHLVEDEAPLLKIKQLVRHSGCGLGNLKIILKSI